MKLVCYSHSQMEPHTIQDKGYNAVMRYRKGGHWAYDVENANIRVI